MKHAILIAFSLFLGFASPALAISDVAKTDASYSAIEQAISKGYLSIFDNDQFLPDKPLTRRELALILQKVEATQLDLSKSEIQELKRLSQSFKKYLADQDASAGLLGDRMKAAEQEQKVLHYDLSKAHEEIESLKKENQTQQLWIWGALALGIVGALK